jgi:hypothetical protein
MNQKSGKELIMIATYLKEEEGYPRQCCRVVWNYSDPENSERVKMRLKGEDLFYRKWDLSPANERWDDMDAEDRIISLLLPDVLKGDMDAETAYEEFLSMIG